MKRKGKEINRNLSLPEISTIESIKQFPRYSSILERQNGEGVGIEELDTLQMEIETLLVNALQRARAFQIELLVLDNKAASDVINQVKQPVNKPKISIAPSSPIHHPLIEPPPPQQQQQTHNAKRFKGSNAQQRPSSTFTCNTDENSLVIRNDISDIFWNMVQPYCNEITDDDIKYLKDQIDINSKIQSNFCKEIPSLGRHYTLKWAEEDVGSEIRESTRLNLSDMNGSTIHHADRKRKNFNSFFNEIDAFNQQDNPDTTLQYGPLTQRLISALIEQNLMAPFSNADFEEQKQHKKNRKTNLNYNQPEQMKSSNLFENKIRDELIEQGILDKTDLDNIDNNNKIERGDRDLLEKDEIADEIKKLQSELLLVSEKCKDAQLELLANAKEAMTQQNLRKKIDQCDLKIQELFAKSLVLKQSKKCCPRKDKDKFNELIKERECLKNQLSTTN